MGEQLPHVDREEVDAALAGAAVYDRRLGKCSNVAAETLITLRGDLVLALSWPAASDKQLEHESSAKAGTRVLLLSRSRDRERGASAIDGRMVSTDSGCRCVDLSRDRACARAHRFHAIPEGPESQRANEVSRPRATRAGCNRGADLLPPRHDRALTDASQPPSNYAEQHQISVTASELDRLKRSSAHSARRHSRASVAIGESRIASHRPRQKRVPCIATATAILACWFSRSIQPPRLVGSPAPQLSGYSPADGAGVHGSGPQAVILRQSPGCPLSLR